MAKARSIYPRHFIMSPVKRQPTGFILMPFAPTFNDICKAIRRGISDAGFQPKRADDQFLTRASLEKILRGILEAEVVVADMTGRNANVFYEVGIAHATKENVVLLAQNIRDDLPFDLQHIDHLEYLPSEEGLKILSKRLLAIIESLPSEPQVIPSIPAYGGLSIRDGVQKHEFYRFRDSRELRLTLHLLVTNESNQSLTLVRPFIAFNHKDIKAEFQFWRIETGTGRKSISMSRGRTAVISASFIVMTSQELKKGLHLSGILSLKVAQPKVEPRRYRFRVTYELSR